MTSGRRLACLLAVVFCALRLSAQNDPGKGWSSLGVLPFGGYDFNAIMKAPDRYVAYFSSWPSNTPETDTPPIGRAFSTDLKTWTLDTNDLCATSGDLCSISSRPYPSGAMRLPDGSLRMFIFNGGGYVSVTSTDGVTWTREAGFRLIQNNASIFERQSPIGVLSVVDLPDGSNRMYYVGGIIPGSGGTPSYYTCAPPNVVGEVCGVILSASSKDHGFTWTRDPGVRINPLLLGPVGPNNTWDAQNLAAVAVTENGRPLYRIYTPGPEGTTASYISDDGLSFTWEGQTPTTSADVKAFTLPDGRIWLETDANAIVDTIVYGPQSFFLSKSRVDASRPPAIAQLQVTGTSASPVTFEVVNGNPGCIGASAPSPCVFHPEYYSFSPPSGIPPIRTTLNYNGPIGYHDATLIVHARGSDTTAVGAVFCGAYQVGNPSSPGICGVQTLPSLPQNDLTFSAVAQPPSPSRHRAVRSNILNFSTVPNGATVLQTSDILYLGGSGYAFTATSSVPWATVSPSSGTAPQHLTVTVDPTGLAAGTYTGTVTISAESTTEILKLTAVLSGTPTNVIVPSVVGALRADAIDAIQHHELSLGNVTTANSDTVQPGYVISQSPAGGTSVAAGSPVDLVVSAGPKFTNLLYFNAQGICHAVDTRSSVTFFGGAANGPPSLSAGQARTLNFSQGGCGTATAKAYALNISVAPSSTLGSLTIWPTGSPQPSTPSLVGGGSNALIVPIGTDGGINVVATDATDLMIDINGYFDPVPVYNSASLYFFTPCRAADTRSSSPIAANTARDFSIGDSPCLASTPGKQAYLLSATAIPSGPLASLELYPTGRTRSALGTTLSAPTGATTTNTAIATTGFNASAGTGGWVSAFATSSTDLTLDANGYFGTPGRAGSLEYQPVPACRAADTRNATPIAAGTSRDFVISGSCGVPYGVGGYALNVTVIPRAGAGSLTLWPSGQPRPAVTNTSWSSSAVATGVIVQTSSDGRFSVFASSDADVVIDVNGYFAVQ